MAFEGLTETRFSSTLYKIGIRRSRRSAGNSCEKSAPGESVASFSPSRYSRFAAVSSSALPVTEVQGRRRKEGLDEVGRSIRADEQRSYLGATDAGEDEGGNIMIDTFRRSD